MIAVARFALLLAAVAVCAAPARAQTGAYAWVQYAADGTPHARVAVAGACPALTVDGAAVPMTVRVPAAPGFDRVLCDAPLPADARSIRAGNAVLPPSPRSVRRIAVLGDSGCRIKGVLIQNCNDPAAWPFARIARAIANDKPDLIVHVGDYQYRETACAASDARCANTPFGDTWPAWDVDFFAPASPLFGAAPLVFARGNHEDCTRAGLGWSRYLAPEPSAACRDHEAPAIVSFDDLRIANVDSANGDEANPDPAAFERDERVADASAHGRETWLLTHRPPLAYLATHAASDPNGPHLSAIIAGHVHLFAALPFAGAPPAIIVGTGGDTLSKSEAPEIAAVFQATSEARFGYAMFERTAGGWTISERDPDGSEHRRCTLHDRTVHC